MLERRPLGVEDCALYPLFTEDVLDLMRRLIPPERQGEVATSIVITAARPALDGSGAPPDTS